MKTLISCDILRRLSKKMVSPGAKNPKDRRMYI
jgi:hypothetical protein